MNGNKTGTNLTWVENMDTLARSAGNMGAVVMLLGYRTPGDGGGGMFIWGRVRPGQDDGGTIIHIQGQSGWKRQYDGHLNVQWFGARGNGEVDDGEAIQSAIDAMPNRETLYFPAGTYLVGMELNCNKLHGRLASSGAVIKGKGGINAVLNLCGTSHFSIDGLVIEGVESDSGMPGAGIVVGRSGAKRIGNWITLRNVTINGSFDSAALYNSCAENFTAITCSFINKNALGHAYFDTYTDARHYAPVRKQSNSTKRFFGCGFYLAASRPKDHKDRHTSCLVKLDRSSNISFRDCYFSFLGGTGFVFGVYNATRHLTLENIRVELNTRKKRAIRAIDHGVKEKTGDNQRSRLIHVDNAPSPLTGLELRGLDWHVPSTTPIAGLVEIIGKGIEHSDMVFPPLDPKRGTIFKSCILVNGDRPPKSLRHCTVTVPVSSMIVVDTDADVRHNIVFVMDGSDSPFSGAGIYGKNNVVPAT